MKKVGVITFHDYDNYGAILQSYALQTCLTRMGAQAEIIDYACDYIRNPFQLRRIRNKGLFNYIYGAIGYICYLPRRKRCREFRKRLAYSQPVNRQTVASLDGQYDVFIAGSDQVWDWHLTDFDQTYFLDFVTRGRRCSYAASIGEHLPDAAHAEAYRALLGRFDRILMREAYGADVVEQLTGSRPDCTCDPTLLLSGEEWAQLMAPGKARRPYILVYQLGVNPSFVQFVKRMKKKTGLDVVYVPFPLVGALACSMQLTAGPMEWLRLFHDAQCVVTDSFHGVVFALQFGKPFFARVDGHHKNRRVSEFLTRLKLTDRIIRDDLTDEQLTAPVDFTFADAEIRRMRADSLEKLGELIR